jgi:cytolysin-activating lysine-acyltransferase
MNDTNASNGVAPGAPPPGTPRTVAEALGQVVWLLSQSPLHRELKIKDLEWSFMPALLHEQFRLFRYGPLPGMEQIDPQTFAPLGMSPESLSSCRSASPSGQNCRLRRKPGWRRASD